MAEQPLGCARCVSWFTERNVRFGATSTDRDQLRVMKDYENDRSFSFWSPHILRLVADGWTAHDASGFLIPVLAETQVAGTLLCSLHAFDALEPTARTLHERRTRG